MSLMKEEDRISYLPDCLLVEIMSRMKTEGRINERTLTTKEVIRTTVTISKRWQHLWTLLPKLIFVDEHDIINNDDDGLTRYASFIDKTLTQSPSFVKLDKFKLYTTFNSRDNPEFKSQVIRWIRHAIIHRNVQKVHFMLWDVLGEPSKFIFDDVLFFNNTCFRKMKLHQCLLNPPNGVIRWENLEVLHLSKVRLDEDMIQNVFSGTPCLECLGFEDCYGYRRIDITSKSLELFHFNHYHWFEESAYNFDNYIDCIEINAPHLERLVIQGGVSLKNILLLNVSSLIQAELTYWIRGFGSELEEEMLKGLIESLSHVNHISFGDDCSEVLSRLESKGFHFFESTDDDDDTDSSLSDSSEIVAENAKESALGLVSEVKTDILAVLDCLEKEREAKMALREELGRAEQNVLNANEKVKMHEQLSASLKKYIIRLLDELREAKRVNNQLESEKDAILQEVSTLRAHNTIHDQPNKRRSRRRM